MESVWTRWLKCEIDGNAALQQASTSLMRPLDCRIWRLDPEAACDLTKEYARVSSCVQAMIAAISVLDDYSCDSNAGLLFGEAPNPVDVFLHFLPPHAKDRHVRLTKEARKKHSEILKDRNVTETARDP